MNATVQGLLTVAAALGALVAIAAAVRRIWRFLDGWEDALTTLREIAEQFKPDGGTSLLDRITHLETSVHQIQQDLEPVLLERRTRYDDPDGTPI
jgi:hypothetical protein